MASEILLKMIEFFILVKLPYFWYPDVTFLDNSFPSKKNMRPIEDLGVADKNRLSIAPEDTTKSFQLHKSKPKEILHGISQNRKN